MRIYVGVVHKNVPSLDSSGLLDGQLISAARRSLPFATTGVPAARWTAGNVLLAAWSNESDDPRRPLLDSNPNAAHGFSGYLLGDGPDPAGVWARFAATPDRLTGSTSASGAEVVFFAENPELVVIGNNALLVHLVADPTGPHADLVGLAGVFNAGFCTTDRTAFRAVAALGPDHTVVAECSGLRITDREARSTGEATAEDVAVALMASIAPLADRDEPVLLGLTGGRDSRLLAALLTRAGVPLKTRTSGNPDDPDVVVGRQVADALGIPHVVGGPMGLTRDREADTLSIDVAGRLHEAVVLANGMFCAYDRVGRINGVYNASLVPFSGAGGEILRGYYAGAVAGMDQREVVQRYLRGRVLGSRDRMTHAMQRAYEADLEPWRRQVREQGAGALEDYYVRQRTGRWTGMARQAASIGSLAWRPYLDHHVVETVRRVPLQLRTDERLIADLLDVLAPELHDIRFAGSRWKFDKHPPTAPGARAAWEARAPLVGNHGDQSTFSWRADLPEVRTELAEAIAQAPDSFWEIADRHRMDDFLIRASPSRANTVRMWHWATVATALATDFATGPDRLESRERLVVVTRIEHQARGPSRNERIKSISTSAAKRALVIARRLQRTVTRR
ncbi:MAG TPA: asparagine synthase-related protein [Nocardioides sp.]